MAGIHTVIDPSQMWTRVHTTDSQRTELGVAGQLLGTAFLCIPIIVSPEQTAASTATKHDVGTLVTGWVERGPPGSQHVQAQV